jgi:hypothetical protein
MAGAAGAQIAASGFQPPIGAYVEAPTETAINAATNYIGMNGQVAYKTNVLGQGSVAVGPTIPPQPDWIVPDNDNDVAGGTSQWVQAAGTIAEGGTCTVAAGAATAGAGTYVCNVKGGVVAGDFFWATVAADSLA